MSATRRNHGRDHAWTSTLATGALLLCLLQGCASPPDRQPREVTAETSQASPLQLETPGLFQARPAIPDSQALHALSEAQNRDLQRYLNNPARHHIPRHELLFEYLQNITANFTYYGQTLPASEALEQQSGNCMSLAVLTTALANAAGIDIGYQLMEDLPVFEYEGSLVFKGVHLRTILYQKEWTPPVFASLVVARPGLQVDYFPTNRERFIANVPSARYLAMYYQNIAVEALEVADLNTAYWYALEALKQAPDHADAINTLAVVHRRAGDLAKAEQLYLYGLETGDNKPGLLKNYQALLLLQGREDEARKVANQLESFDDPSPYNWLHLAQTADQQHDFASARRYYRKAIALAPNLHEAHLGLALASFRAGDLVPARKALKNAIANANKPATRRLYESKLEALSRLMQHSGS